MGKCKICGKSSSLISSYLGLCLDCILNRVEAKKFALEAHATSRREFGLPEKIPRTSKGLQCNGCGNRCKIAEGERGFCGLVENRGGLVRLAGAEKALAEWYYDELPTNCVASWICPVRGCEYSKYAKKEYNLSVFYGACNFNCLFCQNWHFRHNLQKFLPIISVEELATKVNKRVACVCFFGGDPSPQLQHAIKTSEVVLERKKVRICMETNGNANRALLRRFAEIALESGGIIKFDLKCKNEALSFALSGVSNKTALKNFKSLVELDKKMFIHASTLLIPGYVEENEVDKISRFIADLDPTVPYSLLAFWPTFFMSDLPLISKKTAERCYEIAKSNGLKRVRIGNVHLLR